jgi:predicted nucleic acid-binding protein
MPWDAWLEWGEDMKIYMDVCCLNRPFDDQRQDRIYLEAEAILAILSRCQGGAWTIVASDIIDLEVSRLSNIEKLEKVRALYSLACDRVSVTDQSKERARLFQRQGVKLFDSLHLALAEAARCDVLLTTDDSFLSTAGKTDAMVSVANPVTWLMEVTRDERK